MEIKPTKTVTSKKASATKKTSTSETGVLNAESKYEKMNVSELKKIIDSRKIEGKSKLTTKKAMIEVIIFGDQNPHDHKGLCQIVSKYGKKKNVPSSEGTQGTEEGELKPPTLLLSKVKVNSKSSDGGFFDVEIKKVEIEELPSKEKGKRTEEGEHTDEEKEYTEEKGKHTEEEDYENVVLVKRPKNKVKEVGTTSSKEEKSKQTSSKDSLKKTEFDEKMTEILSLTRKIGKRLKYAAREAKDDEKFKEFWLNELHVMKDSMDEYLGIQGVDVDSDSE
jgi:hypothetical protein